MKAAEDLLNILGLAKDSTKAQVQELGQLVYHVCKERKQYLEIKKGASPSRKELLNELATDSHRLGNLSKLVKQAAEEYESVEDAGPEDGVRVMLYCQRCYRITRVLRTVFSGWEGRWHMKSLHGKELEEGDLKASVTAVLAEARH
ncbi:hypothetical protein NLJ89_g10091 [Agrocybe chaxingu]|uniref:Uncharacterized protein n=1 Tax=Agrocybe chaxingu TaxID=84603 RepID=A0A9W8JSD2_9AGAR|nr:hypothetical protein NLJ89_g10091 [Agrocybe chaxingu]